MRRIPKPVRRRKLTIGNLSLRTEIVRLIVYVILTILTWFGIDVCTRPGEPPPIPIPGRPSPKPPSPAPSPPGTPAPTADPLAATARLRSGSGGCTCTLIGWSDSRGLYLALSAAHCVRGPGAEATITLKDGRIFSAEVIAVDRGADISVLAFSTDKPVPYAKVASSPPAPGTPIWHQGYGIHRPGNRENGTIVHPGHLSRQCDMRLSVSSGDSGSGIFRADTGELVSIVCCSGRYTNGASVPQIRRILSALSLSVLS